MTILFCAKTHEGYMLKILAELLHNNIKNGCFELDRNGIRLTMMDSNRTVMIDLGLEHDKFSLYKFNNKEKMHIGLNMLFFHKILKSIKKKDSVELAIYNEDPTELVITVIPRENNRSTTSSIKIQNIQNIEIDIPKNYDKSIIINSSEFQKMFKELVHISNTTNVSCQGHMLKFACDAGGVMKRCITFGEEKDDEDDDYSDQFDTEQLTKIGKIAGLNEVMQIYPSEDMPLLIRSVVGNLGTISIYLKSKCHQDMDSKVQEDD